MRGSKPRPGNIFAIPLRHRWWGAAKLIHVPPPSGYRFLVFEGFWRFIPERGAFVDRGYVKNPFGWDLTDPDREWKGWFSEDFPERFHVIHGVKLSNFERSLDKSEGTTVYQSPEDFSRRLDEYRRWLDDPEKVKAEWGAVAARQFAREEKRRESLTLEQMARERPFGNWKDFWPEDVVKEARQIFRMATTELIGLEGTQKRKQRIEILRGVVDAFNDLDKEHHCIETSEREQVIIRIEELAALVGLKNGRREKLTGHRIW